MPHPEVPRTSGTVITKATTMRPIALPAPSGADGLETFRDKHAGRATAYQAAIDRRIQRNSRIDVAIEER